MPSPQSGGQSMRQLSTVSPRLQMPLPHKVQSFGQVLVLSVTSQIPLPQRELLQSKEQIDFSSVEQMRSPQYPPQSLAQEKIVSELPQRPSPQYWKTKQSNLQLTVDSNSLQIPSPQKPQSTAQFLASSNCPQMPSLQ
jgi:hypothetical protein